MAGEVPALRDGGKVGAVIGQDAFEDFSRLVGFVGDDVEPVLVASAVAPT